MSNSGYLPGVQDSNAARSAVADTYMRQCSGLFIAAPINRAINDKAAQNLPSAQFKRQMKLDGLLSSVTFIGTTTDNITVSEALRTLELDEDLKDIELQFEESVKQEEALEMELEQAKTNISDITQAFRDAGPNMKEWSALKSSCKKGYRVVAPAPKSSTKRKRTTRSDKKTSKRGKRADDSDSADEQTSESSDDFDELDESDDDMATQPALTMDQILAKLEKLKATREKARENREAATSHKNDIEAKIKSTKQARRELKGKRKMVCISGRNAWSRTRIQDDYARGIKELDQECAEQEDGDDFDPSVELRDYRQMAHTLPVFCVSSKSFQILSGRFQSDEASPGFTSADETEIPQLKAHCLQLTGKARIKSSMAFLDGFTKLFFSYVCGHPAAPQASSYQMQSASARRRTFKMGFRKWIEALELVKRRLCRRLTRFFLDNIQKFFPKACQGATEASFTKGLLWSQREDKGDVHWGTYRAIIRRNGGPYKNPKGSYDFNKELGLLFEKYITAGWDKSFQTVVPDTIRRHAADMTKALTSSHDDVSKRAKRYPTGQYAVGIMSTKLALFQRDIARGLESVNEAVVSMQKVANRQVAPVIAAAMDATYKKCATESGKTSSSRCKLDCN